VPLTLLVEHKHLCLWFEKYRSIIVLSGDPLANSDELGSGGENGSVCVC